MDRYRFQFEMIASYLTGFLTSGAGFGPIAAANSRSAAFGACTVAAAEKLVAEECDRHTEAVAKSKATTTNAKFNSRFMENLHSS